MCGGMVSAGGEAGWPLLCCRWRVGALCPRLDGARRGLASGAGTWARQRNDAVTANFLDAPSLLG